MVTLVTRKKGNKVYYYLRHDDGKVQREIYVGKKIPKNIQELKRSFYLRILRQGWRPKLQKIKHRYSEFLKSAPKAEIDNHQEIFSYDFTHDSNKIEGSSLTKQETRKLLRFRLTPTNKPESDMIEAKNHHTVFLEMIAKKTPICSKNVLAIHYDLFHDTKPQFAGKIRSHRIVVRGSKSTFPHPSFVPALLEQFFKWYDSAKRKENPVELAGLVHFRFVSVHPFGDGNGRISRLLMNNVLNEFGYPMLNIKYSDRYHYYNALENAQTGLDEIVFLKWFVDYYIKHVGD
ncbi:Fic family protein [Candidatus Parcubacteria bacterium]|nr:MAG: Fic family protein [Candidatus Parcubacteria bacterium]